MSIKAFFNVSTYDTAFIAGDIVHNMLSATIPEVDMSAVGAGDDKFAS